MWEYMGFPPTLPYKKLQLAIGTILKHKQNNNFIFVIGYTGSTYMKPNRRGGTSGGWGYCEAYRVYYQNTMEMGTEHSFEEYEEIIWEKDVQLDNKQFI